MAVEAIRAADLGESASLAHALPLREVGFRSAVSGHDHDSWRTVRAFGKRAQGAVTSAESRVPVICARPSNCQRAKTPKNG